VPAGPAPVAGAGPGVRVGVAGAGAGAAVSTPAGPVGLPARNGCPTCGGDNAPGMNFCRLCGSPLGRSAPAPLPVLPTPVPGGRMTPAAAPPEVHTCRRCGGQTQAGFAFCQHCGAMLPTSPAARAGHTPPIERIADGPAPAVGPTDGRALVHGAAPAPAPSSPSVHIVANPTPTPPPRATGERPWGMLYSVRRDGTDGDRHPLTGDWVEIGRQGVTSTDLAFDDRYLAARHARIEQQPGGGCRVVPIDLLNGVYRRVRAPHVIPSGTQILVGRELLRFELVEDGERDQPPLVRFGVAMFGSPPRSPWGRLVQVLPSGGLRDVRHLLGAEVVLGREEGDIVFRDDEFLSRRHAALKWQGGQCVLEDLKSSNGTFVRLRGPQPIESGDTLRMGDQMFRVELGVGRGERGA
jgi:pSer/pThr/pTyr-binding forkhead associated (FHA) protein